MKRGLFFVVVLKALLMVLVVQAKPLSPTDSLVIRFANRTRLVIYGPDKASIQALSNYDLNKIVREMGMKLDSVSGGPTAISQDGGRFLKDTVLVVTQKKDGMTVIINGNTDSAKPYESQKDKNDQQDRQASERAKRRREGGNFDYGVSFGLNNFIQQSALPAYPEDGYDLQPLGSRYFALSVGAMPTIIRGKYASLKLYYGVELAWNNFMFEGNNIVEKTATGVAFPDAGRDLQKSKLTVCTIGVPVVPRVTFYNSDGRKVCHIGLGGYVNYRLDSYRKIKEADGSKNRLHSDYYLNNIRYGLVAHLGIRSFDFFVKYDLNPLFEVGKGPDLRTLTFGVGF
ncbi:outer membrane beta-barrel protein [Spirosoma foliorum]|uniref:Outer membrane beta-barrel protein n=1 Tax=Spirosoma foliorum TaxID=2710596 RepID=A0A7G5GUI3_9BACT|nr:outer membrane beta-barrel protein [Spirosoma foliorum]QMW02525.1 outer membrane beta-barrel protein [Spirosoma foliorum]